MATLTKDHHRRTLLSPDTFSMPDASQTPQTHASSAAPMPTTTSPSAELRHITSNTNLVTTPSRERKLSNRNSQYLRTHRLGSRSPNSIPSSPTSVHSSSSAIFERDIEPISPSPSTHITDPHRMPRGQGSSTLDQSVPTVLDSAATVLATSSPTEDDLDTVSIITPAPAEVGSGFTSPTSRLSSRSASPVGARRSLLFSTSPPGGISPPMRPTVQTAAAAPPIALPTPSSAYFSTVSEPESEASSPTTATHTEHPPHALPGPNAQDATPTTTSSPAPAPTTITLPSIPAPPSPRASVSAKRLSFLSYSDILSSTPASTLPLSSITNGSTAEPPHLPAVIGLAQAQSTGSLHGVPSSTFEREGALSGAAVVDDVGGEWEREGLGKGLEERLEALNMQTPVQTLPSVQSRA